MNNFKKQSKIRLIELVNENVRVSHEDNCGGLLDYHPKEKDFIYLLDGMKDTYIQGLEILNLK